MSLESVVLRRCHLKLKQGLSPRNDVADHMYQEGVISKVDLRRIMEQPTEDKEAEELLEILRNCSGEEFETLVMALEQAPRAGQNDLAKLLKDKRADLLLSRCSHGDGHAPESLSLAVVSLDELGLLGSPPSSDGGDCRHGHSLPPIVATESCSTLAAEVSSPGPARPPPVIRRDFVMQASKAGGENPKYTNTVSYMNSVSALEMQGEIGAVYQAQEDYSPDPGSEHKCISFARGDLGTLVDRGNYGWWKVTSHSRTGWVPASYWIRKDIGAPNDLSSKLQFQQQVEQNMQRQVWYHGKLSRKDAEDALMEEDREGDFLVRKSGDGKYALSLRHSSGIEHGRISVNTQIEFDSLLFSSMDKLIDYFKDNPLAALGGKKTFLKMPLLRKQCP